MLSIRKAPVNNRLLVVKFWGSQKLIRGFLTVPGAGTSNPELFKGQLCIFKEMVK